MPPGNSTELQIIFRIIKLYRGQAMNVEVYALPTFNRTKLFVGNPSRLKPGVNDRLNRRPTPLGSSKKTTSEDFDADMLQPQCDVRLIGSFARI
jgi:hypothetical protein